MLFDLRSRRRRTAVRIIYCLLALVMVGGLLLVGVGTGSGGGGLLNAIDSNGNGTSASGQSKLFEKKLKKAQAAVAANPKSATALEALFTAKYDLAQSGNNVNATTGALTSSGRKALPSALAVWPRYVAATSGKPALTPSTQAAAAFGSLGQWSNAAQAWNYAIPGAPSSERSYLCLTLTSYAAGDTAKGDLAAPTAVKHTPGLQQVTIKADLDKAKKSVKVAKADATQECA